MRVIELSGPIYNGMWSYGNHYPQFHHRQMGIEYAGEKYSIDVFEGMHAQTGLYVESPGIATGAGQGGLNERVPIEKLFMIDAYVLQVPYQTLAVRDGRPFISLEQIRSAEKEKIPPKAAILVATGYGRNWEKPDYVEKTWFFKKDALDYLMDKEPFLVGGDSCVWENPVHPEGAFDRFYKMGILLLAPCINLELVKSFKVKLTVMPLRIRGSAICPVRAVIVE